ncbi:MAG: hypothetical protein ACFE91_07480 [Promethearchaeota archaeon]
MVQQLLNENFGYDLITITIFLSGIAIISAILIVFVLSSELNAKEVIPRIILIIEGIIIIFVFIALFFYFLDRFFIVFFYFLIPALILISFGIFSKFYRANKILLILGALYIFFYLSAIFHPVIWL